MPTILAYSKRPFWGTLIKFSLVGGLGFLVDIGVFNLLLVTVLQPSAVLHASLIAKTISSVCAIIVNWLGNRIWAFQSRSQHRTAEFVKFLIASLIGMGCALLCLWVSHYLLGLTSRLADNISSQVVGLIVGSVVRFVAYRYWVFRPTADSHVG